MIDDERMLANIASNLRALLTDRDWSLRELIRATSIPLMTLSNLANEKHVPGVIALAKIAEALRTTVDYLLTDHSEKSSPAA